MLIEENSERNSTQEELIQENSEEGKAKNKSGMKRNIYKTTITSHIDSEKKELNTRIYKLKPGVQKFLYFFNLLFNLLFRASLIVILVLEFLEKKENKVPTAVILGLEGACLLLYAIAMTKLLYTKSS